MLRGRTSGWSIPPGWRRRRRSRWPGACTPPPPPRWPQADLVVFVIDARAGVTPADEHFAAWLRRQGRPVLLVANKAEGRAGAAAALEAYLARPGRPGRGLGRAWRGPRRADGRDRRPAARSGAEAEAEAERPLKLAIVGRPNAGKSTLVNRLLGEERMITGPEPGLTRDAVAVLLHDADGTPIELVDTAGLRRRARVEQELEKLSVGAAIGALKMAEVVVLAVDATEGLHEQDLQIARLIEREGRACVIALNKWDAVADRAAARRAHRRPAGDQPRADEGRPGGDAVGADRRRAWTQLLPAVRQAHAVWNTRRADRRS